MSIFAGIPGGGIRNIGKSIIVTNCTFVENRAGEGDAIYDRADASVITNCIFWRNLYDTINTDNASITFNLADDFFPGEGNIISDPIFADDTNGDFRLQRCSPAIDAGTPNAPNVPPTDFEIGRAHV